MKTLPEIKDELKDLNKYSEVAVRELDINTKTEQEFFNKSEIIKYLKEIYDSKFDSDEKIKHEIEKFDIEFSNYLFDLIKSKNNLHQYEFMLMYIDKAMNYFNIKKIENNEKIYFNSFLYLLLYIKFEDISKRKVMQNNSIEPWLFLQRGICYNKLNNYELAIDNLKYVIYLSPMSDLAYEELFKVYLKIEDFESLKNMLDKYYRIASTNELLGIYYYYLSYYYFNKNNYQVCKACIMYAMKFNISVIYKNKLISLLDKIFYDNKIISNLFNTNEKTVLQKYNIPTWYNENLIIAFMGIYLKCLQGELPSPLINDVKRYTKSYNINDYIEQINTQVKTKYNMYLFENFNFSIKLSKKWNVIYINNTKQCEYGKILDAINNEYNISMSIEKCDTDFDSGTNVIIDNLQKNGLNIVKIEDFISIQKRQIKIVTAKLDNVTICSYFVKLDDLLLCITTPNDVKSTKIEILNIIKSIKPFNSIKFQFN